VRQFSLYSSILLALLIYGYATGISSSRKIERATYNSLAAFHYRFPDEFIELFV